MGAAVRVTQLEHAPTTLRAIAAKSRTAEQSRRLLAIALALEGASRAEAARQTGVDRQPLCDWMHRYNALGVDGRIARTASRAPHPCCSIRSPTDIITTQRGERGCGAVKLDRAVWPWTLRIVVVVFYVGLAIYAADAIRTLFSDWQYGTPWPRVGQGHLPAFLEGTPDSGHGPIPLG